MKNSTGTVKHFFTDIYPCNITVFLGLDATEITDYFKEKQPDNEVIKGFDFGNPGFTIGDLDGDVWVYIDKEYVKNLGVIVHECFHVVEFILGYVGVRHGNKSSEAFDDFLQYVFNQVIADDN